ncbi:MAG: hypothetical protein ACPGJF_08545 [Sinimarinibacterium flocculans]|uniref:hypothetical protein n=1 Tax=Sinimarinibacterium flocculans TaxID=985250 RepID=UPI003C5C6529
MYYVKLACLQGTFYKIGFTKKTTLVERMAFGQLGDENLIDREFFFTYREDGWDTEQNLLDHFRRFRAFGRFSNDPSQPLPGRGQSELFHQDVLGLDEDLYDISENVRVERKAQSDKLGNGCILGVVALLLAPFTLGLSLFFMAGSFSFLFEVAKSPVSVPRRPKHSEDIQQLIDALVQGSRIKPQLPQTKNAVGVDLQETPEVSCE